MQDLTPNNKTDIFDDYLESVFETTERLTNFKMVTDQDILLILHTAPLKSCELDAIPTTLLKVYSDDIVPYIMGHSQYINCIRKLYQKHKRDSPQTTIEEEGSRPGPMQS